MKFPVLLFSGLLLCSTPLFAQSDNECTSDADCAVDEICETYTLEACPACEPGTECECSSESYSHCSAAPAPACTSDADCDVNQVCETYTLEACPDCSDDTNCACSSESYSQCSAAPAPTCTSDADCEDGTLCVQFSFESCSSPGFAGCNEGEPCEEPPGPDEITCESEEVNVCVPPYLAPCSTNADCGEGFTCEDLEMCSCSSDNPPRLPGEPQDDSDGSAPAPECECEPTGDTYCALVHTVCETDSDCPSGMDCVLGTTSTIGCEGDSCDHPGDESYCQPLYYGGSYSDAVGEASGREEATVTGASRDDFFEPDSYGSGGGKSEDGGGCATANPGSASLLGLLLGGLMIGRRRR